MFEELFCWQLLLNNSPNSPNLQKFLSVRGYVAAGALQAEAVEKGPLLLQQLRDKACRNMALACIGHMFVQTRGDTLRIATLVGENRIDHEIWWGKHPVIIANKPHVDVVNNLLFSFSVSTSAAFGMKCWDVTGCCLRNHEKSWYLIKESRQCLALCWRAMPW